MCPDLTKRSTSGHLAQPSDVWALGVILFSLVTGKLPFSAEFEADLTRKICSAKYVYPEDGKFVSNGLKNIIRRIFEPVAERRITAAEMLKDPWLVKLAESENPNTKKPIGLKDEELKIAEAPSIKNEGDKPND